MLNVHKEELVVEEKGIYSIENFLIARRLMYWQVYLHKTALSAEKILLHLINRARQLFTKGETLDCPEHLSVFLKGEYDGSMINDEILESYCMIDDFDIWTCIKSWRSHEDWILSRLSRMLIERKLFRVQILTEAPSKALLTDLENKIMRDLNCSKKEARYFYSTGKISNAAYIDKSSSINILTKKGNTLDITLVSDLPNIKAISKIVKKYYLCWPKHVSL